MKKLFFALIILATLVFAYTTSSYAYRNRTWGTYITVSI